MTILKPRGIIKWQPFAALSDTEEIVDEINKINNLTTKPHVSVDIAEEINRALVDTIQNGISVLVDYFIDNQIKSIKGTIKKYDPVELTVVIDTHKIHIKSIINVCAT